MQVKQLGFDFTASAARRADPETCHLSAAMHKSLRSEDRRKALLALARNEDGLTDFDLAKILCRKQTSAGKRRGELRDMGLVEETKLRRPSDTNSPSIVWRITDRGLAMVAHILGLA